MRGFYYAVVAFSLVIAFTTLLQLLNWQERKTLRFVPRGCTRPGFVVVAIFKDEAFTIAEWMSHYRWQGAKHFFLIDNGSSDDWMNELGALGDVTVTTRPEKYKQTEHYDSYLPVLRKEHMCDWALVVDIDEYLYAKPPTSNLAEFFALVPSDVKEVVVQWTMFGSSGLSLQPESVRCSFTWRGDVAGSHLTKSAIRVSRLDQFGVHSHGENILSPDNLWPIDSLQLNHYSIQSREYFEKVKMNRGDVNSVEEGEERREERREERCSDTPYSVRTDPITTLVAVAFP